MWFEKFVFFKRRRQNKGHLPVDIDDLHAFLGVSTGLLCFLLWVLQCFIQITEKWLSSFLTLIFFSSGFSKVSQGIVPADFQFGSVCLFPIYACESIILKLENGQQNVGLSSGNFL